MAQAPRPIGVIFKSVLPSCRVCIFLPFLGFTKSWQPQGYPYYDYDRRYRSVSGKEDCDTIKTGWLLINHHNIQHISPGGQTKTMLNLDAIRRHFPALAAQTIYFDNPGGTQVAQEALHHISHYLQYTNANHGGMFRSSRESDATVAEARLAMADFLNAARPEEIVFGPNMTTLTFSISRSLARTLQPGDEIVVTRLDHDANVAPWLMIAEERGCHVRWVDFHPQDCTLDMEDLQLQITPRTRIVA